MESAFRSDFSQVRVHADRSAAQSARVLDASAYAVGAHIVFGEGAYAPHTARGRTLLAHELAHVVQQRRGGTVPTNDPGSPSERGADAVADSVSAGTPTVTVPGATGVGIACAPMNPRHARGAVGEQGMGFERYPQAEGWLVIEGPSGVPVPGSRAGAGHGVTEKGFDAIAYNTRTGEVHLPDNKSVKASGNVSSANAIDPSRNLPTNIDAAIKRLESSQEPPVQKVVEVLKRAQAALKAGKPLPSELKLVVTGVGGQATGVSSRLVAEGVKFDRGAGPSPGLSKPFDEKAAIEASPAVRARRARLDGRLAGAVKFAAPMVLDMVTAYYVNRNEQKVIANAIAAKVDSPDVKNRVVEEVENHRLDIAYEQLRGASVYVTIELRMSLTNDIMNTLQLKAVSITDADRSSSTSSVMSHDAIVGGENSIRWDTISMPIPPIAVSKSEEAKLRLREFDTPIMSGGPAPDVGARAKLVADIAAAEKEEAEEREAEIARPRVLADPKERAKQQTELPERMRKQNDTSGPQAGAGGGATSDSAGSVASLLPGASGGSPIEKAAAAVKIARAWTLTVHAKGVALEARLGGANRPTDADRQAWVAEEARWRAAMKASMNHFENESRHEAVSALGQLVDEYGPKLAQIHVHLVG